MNHIRHIMLLGLLTALPVVSPATASPVRDLTPVGQSEMHWLFWKLYDIRLLTADGAYREGSYPLALAIRYARDIESKKLVDATLDEWRRLNLIWHPEWAQQLRELWPSVKPGDELVLRVQPNGHSTFYHNETRLGELTDPAFAPAFLAIWLSSETREPALRQQLLGQSPGDPDA